MLLDEYLKKHDLEVADFSKRIGINRTTLWHYRTRKFRPSIHIAEKIVAITKGEVGFTDLGRTVTGEKLPFRLDEIENV